MKERSKTVNGYKSPEGGPDISDHDLNILASAYASCRIKGEKDKTKCSKIAWGAVHRSKKKTEDAPAISGELTSSSIPASDRPENNLGIVKIGVGSTLPKKKKEEAAYQRFFWKLTESESPKEGTEAWAYEMYDDDEVPKGWYVHGRAGRQELTNHLAMATEEWHIAEQYAGKNGSMWLLKPNHQSKVLDMTKGADFARVSKKFISALRSHKFPDIRRTLEYSGKIDWDDLDDEIEKIFNPEDLVDSAAGYDDPEIVDWLKRSLRPDVIILENGAIFMGANAKFDRVKVPKSLPESLHEDLNDRGFSVDLTFLFHDGNIYVKHNHDQAVPLIELLSSKLYPELREMCGIVFDYIEERYRMSPLMQKWKYDNKPWQVILHSFLIRYFKKAYPVKKLEIHIEEDGHGQKEVNIVGEGDV